jgi:uncharacterized membrane protein YcaP (DUF421 family)
MDTVIRALSIYLVLLLVMRAGGKRSLAHITTFDFVLLLILGEATQQALIGDDFSITTGLLLIVALVGIDNALSLLQARSSTLDRLLDGVPILILENGCPIEDRMRKARVSERDILAAARERHGLYRLDQIKYAVLERSGGISIVPEAASSLQT